MKKSPLQSISVLLADDNIHGITARRVILQEAGCEVETALSGEEAWEIYQKKHFDIVITDYKMTGMDGLDLIALIRASEAPARTILVSGFVGPLGMTEDSTGADEVICKSDKEVPQLLRAVKRLSSKPVRRGPGSQKAKSAAATARAV